MYTIKKGVHDVLINDNLRLAMSSEDEDRDRRDKTERRSNISSHSHLSMLTWLTKSSLLDPQPREKVSPPGGGILVVFGGIRGNQQG